MTQLKQLNIGSWATLQYATQQRLGDRMLWQPTYLYNVKKIDQYNNEILLISPRSQYILRVKLGSRTMVLTELDTTGTEQAYAKLRIFDTLFGEIEAEMKQWRFYDDIGRSWQ